MNRQTQIDSFLLAAHRLAVKRLREDPTRVEAARNLLARWRAGSSSPRSDPYWDEWERLLVAGTPSLEAAVCGDDDRAAVLRSTSPLGVLITQREGASLLAESAPVMNRQQVDHVLRAAAAITDEKSFVVIGNQAVLLTHPDAPAALLVSRELDLYPAVHPEKADLIDGAIGALSSFDETFGYHADGVGPDTAVMPADCMARASLHDIGDITVVCPELHDLGLSKCVTARDKHADFVGVMLKEKMIDLATLLQRIGQLDRQRFPVGTISEWARRRAAGAAAR